MNGPAPIDTVETKVAAKKRGRSARFRDGLLKWTAAIHVSWAIAAWWSTSAWLGSISIPLAVLAAIALTWAVNPLVLEQLPDRPRGSGRVHWLEIPFLVHWSACHFSALGIVVTLAAWLGGLPGDATVTFDRGMSLVGAGAAFGYLFGLVVGSWGATVGCHGFRVRHVLASSEQLPQKFDGYRIAHLSDLHIGAMTSDKLVDAWIDATRAEKPNLVVITGDLVTSGVEFHQRIARLVGKFEAPDGVVFVPGNHDYFGDGQPLFGLLARSGVRVLRNEGFSIARGDDAIAIVGVDDDWTGRADPHRAMAGRPASGYTIALVHNPELFPSLAAEGASLVLSGHTHGGQIALPFLARWVSLTSWSNRFRLGIYQRGASTLFVSSGLGCTGIPIRLGVRPEIAVIKLSRFVAGESS